MVKGRWCRSKIRRDEDASYRLQCFSSIPVSPGTTQYKWAATKVSAATNSYLWLPWSQDPPPVKSEGHLDDYKNDTDSDEIFNEVDGKSDSLGYHVYGNDDAFALWGRDSAMTSDIDVHTTYNFVWYPQADPKKVIIHAFGKIVGDQFPAVETFVLDKNRNGVMLGVWQVREGDGPVFTKDGYFGIEGDKRLPMIDFDLKITSENGVFTNVIKDGKTLSLAQHNQSYTSLPTVKRGIISPVK